MSRTGTDAQSFRWINITATAPSNWEIYVYNSSTNVWEPWTPSDVTYTVWVIDSETASENGLVIAWSSLVAQYATASAPWMVSTTTQVFAGKKTFEAVLSQSFVSVEATTPVSVAVADSGTVFTNEWATEKIVFNLPTAAANLIYTFVVQDDDGIDVTANTGDTIRIAADVTSTAGTITSTTIGSVITLVAINDTEWVATQVVWTRA